MSSTNRTVLIVEDEALIAMSIEMQLQDLGFETISVASIAEAQAAIDTRPLDLVILDYSLRNGEKTTSIAETLHQRRVPFVVCSGSQFNDVATIFEGVTVLPKPYSDELLANAVSSALATRH